MSCKFSSAYDLRMTTYTQCSSYKCRRSSYKRALALVIRSSYSMMSYAAAAAKSAHHTK